LIYVYVNLTSDIYNVYLHFYNLYYNVEHLGLFIRKEQIFQTGDAAAAVTM